MKAEREPSLPGSRALAACEIASVVSSVVIAGWAVLPFVGDNKLIGMIPVGLAIALMIVSHRAHGETARDLGWRMDNFAKAARQLALPMLLAGAVLFVAGWSWGSLQFDGPRTARAALWLPLWGLVQQYALQGFINRRAQIIWGRGAPSILATALIFAVLHLPNVWLTIITFIGGAIWAAVYQRVPNLYALGLSHGFMSWLLMSTLPASMLKGLRVAFKYFEG